MDLRSFHPAGDERGLITKWLIRLLIVLALAGLVLFELGSIFFTRVTIEDDAADAAFEAGLTYRETRDVVQATQSAKRAAEKRGAKFVSISIDEQQGEITITLQKTASTLLVHRISAIAKYTLVTHTRTARLSF